MDDQPNTYDDDNNGWMSNRISPASWHESEETPACNLESFPKDVHRHSSSEREQRTSRSQEWWNKELQKERKQTIRLHRVALKRHQDEDWDRYREARNNFGRACRRESRREAWRGNNPQSCNEPAHFSSEQIRCDDPAQSGTVQMGIIGRGLLPTDIESVYSHWCDTGNMGAGSMPWISENRTGGRSGPTETGPQRHPIGKNHPEPSRMGSSQSNQDHPIGKDRPAPARMGLSRSNQDHPIGKDHPAPARMGFSQSNQDHPIGRASPEPARMGFSQSHQDHPIGRDRPEPASMALIRSNQDHPIGKDHPYQDHQDVGLGHLPFSAGAGSVWPSTSREGGGGYHALTRADSMLSVSTGSDSSTRPERSWRPGPAQAEPTSDRSQDGRPAQHCDGRERAAAEERSGTEPVGKEEMRERALLTKSQWKRYKARRNKNIKAGLAAEAGTSQDRAAGNTKRKLKDPEEGPSQQSRAKRVNPVKGGDGPRSFASARRDLALIIHREDGVPLKDAEALLIKNKISDMIEKAVEKGTSGRCLNFATSGLVSEGFLVTPMFEEAKSWLLDQNFGVLPGNIPIRALHWNWNRDRASIWLPGTGKNPADPLKMIKAQNAFRTDLRLGEWRLIHKDTLATGMRLVVDMPQGIISEEPGHVWLGYQATQVRAKLIKPKPSGKDQRTRQDTTDNHEMTPAFDNQGPSSGSNQEMKWDRGLYWDEHSDTEL